MCLGLLWLIASPAFAQSDTATIVGTVRDNTGGVTPGATVTLTNTATGIAVVKVTDANGNFEFMTVRVGRYKVTAELQGFSIALADNLQATVGGRQRVELKLEPGRVSETVEVVGAVTLLETDSSQRGQVITADQAVELPLNGREYSGLALLTPGVRVSSIGTGSTANPREGSLNVNGLRSAFNHYLLDGLDNNAYGTSNQGFSNQVMQPSPDAVAEVKVVTNNLGAEYGRSAGATVNVATRSGKVDYQFSPALTMFARYGQRKQDAFDQPPMPLPSGGAGNASVCASNKQFATGFTWARTGTSLLEFRFGWGSTQGGKDPAALGTPNALEVYGVPGLPTDPRISGGLMTTLVSGDADMGRQATNPQWRFPTMWNPKINYTWVVGKHSLKTGYEYQHISTEVQDVNPLYGRDAYAEQITRPTGASSNNIYNLSDFFFGYRSQYAISNILIANLRQQMHFTYLQDDWRVNNNLTLNLGLRYEYATPHTEQDNILSINGPQVINAVVNQTNPTLSSFRTTQDGYPAGLTDPSTFNPVVANITYMPSDYHSSSVQSYYISVQREIAANMTLDVAYVGNTSSGLLLFANYNEAYPNNSAGTHRRAGPHSPASWTQR